MGPLWSDGRGPSTHGTCEGAGRDVMNAGKKSASIKISGFKGQMPVHSNPDTMLLDVAARGRVMATRLGMSYMVRIFPGCDSHPVACCTVYIALQWTEDALV